MAKKQPNKKAEPAASGSKHTGQPEEQETRTKNQRRAFNKQKRKSEEQLAAAAQAAAPPTQPTTLQEAHLQISDGGPGTASTVPEVVDREPFHPITPTANSSAITGLESNTHGNVCGPPLTRSVDGAEDTAIGTATMATTAGVNKPKRKAWKHRKPKKAVIEKEADRINPNECSTAQPGSSKNRTGPPRLDINNGKAKNPTQTLPKPPASKAGPKADRSAKDSSTKLDLAGTKRKWERVLPPPTDAVVAGWQDFRPSMEGDKRMATGSGAVRSPQPTAEGPILKKRKGKAKLEAKEVIGMATGSGAVHLPQPTAEGPISMKRKGKGKGKNKGKNRGKGNDKDEDKDKGKDEGQEKGKGKEKEKEVAIKEAAEGSARLDSLPTFTTPHPNHPHTHHHSTTPETGQLATIVEESESLVPTRGNMPASTRASSIDRYSTRPTHASRQSGVHLDKFDAPPAERNTRGFQPLPRSQIKQTTSTIPTSASTVQPRSTISIPVGITDGSSILTAHTTPVTSQGADTQIKSTLQDNAQSARVKVTQSGTGQPRVQHLQPTRQTRQAAAVKALGHDEFYGASDEDAPTPASEAIQPTGLRGGSPNPIAHHTDTFSSTLTGTEVKNAEKRFLGPNQVTPSSRLTSQNGWRVLPEDVAGQPGRDSGSSKNPVYLTPMPAATYHINVDLLPTYAWNKGINPKYQKTAPTIQHTTAVVSAKSSTRHFEQSHEDGVNETPFTSEPRSKLVTPTGPAEPSDEDIHAAGAKLASVGVQEVKGEPQKANAENDHYTPPHLRVPKPRLDPSRPITVATVTPPTISPEGNEPPSHVGSLSTTAVTQSRHTINAPETVQPDRPHLPPHMRPPKGKKLGPLEPNAGPILHSAVSGNNSAGEEVKTAKPTIASGARLYANGKERALPSTNEEKPNIRGGELGGSRDLSDTTRRLTRMEKIMRDKGYSPPPKGRIRVIGDWETVEPTWEERDPHDYDAPEHQSHLHEWSGRIAQEIGEEPVIVDTTAPGFATGTYVPVEGRLESAVSEDAHETYRLDDPYTERKSNQTAQAAIEALLKKKEKEEPERPTPTKAQKQEARALQRERKLHQLEMERNHPNKPIADIYIRPAEEKDLGAMAEIFNWYIKNTAATAEVQPKNIVRMREVMQEAREDGFDMYVAVQRSGRSGANGHNHRVVSEPICGFTYANDVNGQHHSFVYTAEIYVYASHDHPHVGIGRCLFDRMMDLLDLNYVPKGGCEWRGQQLLTRREIKKIQVNIPYWDKVEADNESLQWRGNWLTGQGASDRHFMKFEYQGTMKEIGWKQMKTVSQAQFLHDTLIDISRKQDNLE